MAKPRVDRGAGLARLGLVLVLVLAGAAYAVLTSMQEANAPPPKPTILKLDSQRDKG
ncbi:MAG: hypothetical protein OEM24_02355 [Paracoccaceae bacterium]|nr:hypothetical protein [Paracoccaceae bacterium]